MRRRRRRRKTPWHFDDWDERDYILDKDIDTQRNHSVRNNQSLAVLPNNASFQIHISGNISICLVGANGGQEQIFRLVVAYNVSVFTGMTLQNEQGIKSFFLVRIFFKMIKGNHWFCKEAHFSEQNCICIVCSIVP